MLKLRLTPVKRNMHDGTSGILQVFACSIRGVGLNRDVTNATHRRNDIYSIFAMGTLNVQVYVTK